MKRQFNRSKRRSRAAGAHASEYGPISYGYQGKPIGDNRPDYGINVKALRGLPKSSYSVQADPYTAALPGSEPYAVINAFNKTIGGYYGGDRNIDGGNVQQYANSLRSKFLNASDFIRLKLGINYHYIPISTANPNGMYAGKTLIDEQIRATSEATSTLQSTTFTQMAIYNYAVATDMPMGSSYDANQTYNAGTQAAPVTIPLYTNLNDVIYASLRWYQMFWLKVLGVFDWHNSFRLKMGTMIRSSWNRETAILNGFFGLLKKKSFIALLNSMSLSLPGEYIDREFALQFAKTCLVPSRRSNALTEPVIETQVEYNMPKRFILLFRNGTGNDATYTPVFDSATDLLKNVPGIPVSTTFDQAVDTLMDLLSAEGTMAWARSNDASGTNNDNVRYNSIKYRLDVVQACITTVKRSFTDIREVIDTCARTGIITWYKGFRPSVVKDDDAALFRNLIVDDIVKLAMSGANSISLDVDTKRFRTFTMWNMYDGIPEFDAFSGGSFLTFSLKNVTNIDNDPDLLIGYIPQCLTFIDIDTNGNVQQSDSPIMYSVTRKGVVYTISTTEVQLSNFVGTRRLVPLSSQDNLVARVATITPPASPTVEQANDISLLARTLVQITGLCYIDTSTPVIYQDPDLLSVYQIEISSISI